MKYLCLVCVDKEIDAGLSDAEKLALHEASMAYDQELMRTGHYIRAEALMPPETATTLRVRKGKRSMTDGPYVETKEHVAGFILIEARDLNEALEIASRIPLATIGSVEVRPIMEFD